MTDLSKLINMESVQMINPTTILITNKIIMYMFIRVRMNKKRPEHWNITVQY